MYKIFRGQSAFEAQEKYKFPDQLSLLNPHLSQIPSNLGNWGFIRKNTGLSMAILAFSHRFVAFFVTNRCLKRKNNPNLGNF